MAATIEASATQNECALSDDLLFFRDPLELISTARSADQEALPPARTIKALAHYLVTPEAAARWPTPFEALRSPQRHLQRAELLLLEAERAERLEPGRASAVWDEVEAEWAWVRQATYVKEQLRREALARGLADPESSVDRILEAIDEELLPVLHLKWLLASPEPAGQKEMHLRHLREWTLRPEASSQLIECYGWYLLALLEAEEPAPTEVSDSVVAVVRSRGAQDPAVNRLLSRYAALQLRHAIHQMKVGSSASWFERTAVTVERVVGAGGVCLATLESLASLHLMTGICHARNKGPEGLPSAARHLVKAVVFDPYDGAPRKQLQQVLEVSDRLHKETEELAAQGRLGPDTRAMLDRMFDGVHQALAYAESDEARMIAEKRDALILPGLAHRLSLDPARPDQLDRMRDLVLAIDECARADVAADDYPAMVRGRAIQRRADLAELPWERVSGVLEQGILPSGRILPLLMPEPEPPKLAAVAAPVRNALGQDASSAVVMPSRPRAEWFNAWLFSRRDLAYKVAAVLGILLLGYSVWGRTAALVRRDLADRAYANAAAGVRSGDDAATIDAALGFFKRLPDSVTGDDRVPQVTAWLDNAMLRRTVTLLDGGRTDEVQNLLQRYERARVRPPLTTRASAE